MIWALIITDLLLFLAVRALYTIARNQVQSTKMLLDASAREVRAMKAAQK